MNFLGDKITTATTIAETVSELASTELFEVQAFEGKQKLISNYKKARVSKSNIVRKVNNIQEIQQVGTQVLILPKSHNTKIRNLFQTNEFKIIDSLQKLFFKKKRFIFQILKQFFLFPDDSESSITTLSTYDPLIFKDEIIHSLVKKMETKIIENKIWGFLNLRMRPYLQGALKIERISNKIQEKVTRIQKKISFDLIKKISDDLISCISKESHCFEINSNLSLQNEGMKCFIDEKKKLKGRLNSGIIKEIVSPVKNQNLGKIELQNRTRIYTRQEYEKKYGKSLDSNDNFRVTKYQPSEGNIRETQHVQSHQSQQNRKNWRSPYVSSVANKHTQTSQTQNKEHSSSKKAFHKYNIIHYHERPRELSQTNNRFQSIGPNVQCSYFSCSSCYCGCCEYGNSCCPNYRTEKNQVVSCCYLSPHQLSPFKDKYQNFKETAFTEKHKSTRLINSVNSPKKFNPKNGLSELESRIQYLNFLRKVVKQQQAEHETK